MVASIGAVASPSQGASYYERDGYYAKDSPEHRAASGWAGRGAAELGLEGPVEPGTFKAVLEGEVPDGSGKRLGRRMGDGEIHHRPGRDLTFSAPKSVSLAALVGGDARIVEAHDRAVGHSLDWFERNAAETRVQDQATGRMVRAGDQKTVIARFRHETSRNLDPALHTHSVIANMLLGDDGKWRTMANESLYASKMLLGALYRSELAGGLKKLGYGIERTHSDGRFEIAGVSRHIIDAYSTRRAEIEAAMEDRGLGSTAENQHLARRAALMTRAAKRDVDREALRETWARQAAELGFDANSLVVSAMERGLDGAGKERNGIGDAGKDGPPAATRPADLFEHAARSHPAREAVDWALSHLSERDAVFARTDLLAAALAYSPGDPGRARAYGRELSRRRIAEHLAAGLCPKCGKDSPAPGRTLCEPCGVKRRVAERARYTEAKAAGKLYGGRDPEQRRRLAREKSRRRLRERLDAGLCTRCGQRPPVGGGTICGPCRGARQAAEQVLYAARRAAGLCVGCGENTFGGAARCGPCAMLDESRRSPERKNAAARRRYAERRVRGQCTDCGGPSQGAARCAPCAKRSYERSEHFRGIPIWDPQFTVIELATGEDHGTYDSEAEVAACLAFAKLSWEQVEVLRDVSPMATYTARS